MALDGVERRLAAILSADVVGYSRLMAADEQTTVGTITAYRTEIANLVGDHRGRVVDATGDNALAEFPTALDAVEAAVEIQSVLKARNERLPDERRMEFRLGVHMGDVTVEGERIYGDGVNIAARLQGLAEPGGICISGAVHEQVESKLDLRCDDLGEQSLKNIPNPVHVYRVRLETEASPQARSLGRFRIATGIAVVIAVTTLAVWRMLPSVSAPDEIPMGDGDEQPVSAFAQRPAVAVLPFDNLSGNPEEEYFVDGVADDLVIRLASWRGFPVISRFSSFSYKRQSVDVQQVARDLGAGYLVEGSVRRAGDRIRINAKLIDGASGRHIWTEQYERGFEDILALQDEISQAIVAAMYPQLQHFDRERARHEEPDNLDAWDWAQRGWWHFTRESLNDNTSARESYEQAIKLDPSFASAFSGLALTHYQSIASGWTDEESIEKLVSSAESAVALDSQDPIGYHALGHAHALNGKRDEMIAAFELSIDLNPSSALAYMCSGESIALAGRPAEAIRHLEKALQLSPKDPGLVYVFHGMALAHFAAQRYEEAVDWAKRAISQKPDFAFIYRTLATTYAHLGQLEEARAALDDAERLAPEFTLASGRRVLLAADPLVGERYLDGLRKAGMKD